MVILNHIEDHTFFWKTRAHSKTVQSEACSHRDGHLSGKITVPHTGLACVLHRFESVSVVVYADNEMMLCLRKNKGKKYWIGKTLAFRVP